MIMEFIVCFSLGEDFTSHRLITHCTLGQSTELVIVFWGSEGCITGCLYQVITAAVHMRQLHMNDIKITSRSVFLFCSPCRE